MSRPTRFFISRAGEDIAWGQWIATAIRSLGHEVFVQEDDLHLGDNIVGRTRHELADCDHLVAVLSHRYLEKPHTLRELNAAVMRDPDGRKHHLMVVRVDDCQVPNDVAPLARLTLSDQSDQSRNRLLAQLFPTAHAPATHITFLGNLPPADPHLIGRTTELAQLEAAWADPATNFIQIIAPGGTGKTALVDKFFRPQVDKTHFFGWSFFSQGVQDERQTSSDPFFAELFRTFAIPPPEVGSPYAKAAAVTRLFREQRVLMVLDGVEPLQDQHTGGVRDTALGALLHDLALRQRGLVVCTTRERITDIHDDHPRAQSIPLPDLDPDHGAQYLRNLGVVGPDTELRDASQEFGNNALALTLLGTYLADFCQGDVRQRTEIPRLLDADDRHGKQARRAMDAYAKRFDGMPELDLLHALGYFNRPAEPEALKLVLSPMTDLQYKTALSRLRKGRLIRNADTRDIDCHPLVREHFSALSRPEGHSRLYEYYSQQAPHQPDTIETMEPFVPCRLPRVQGRSASRGFR